MEKYDVISVVGEGSYGLVMRCRHRESGQYVAIKKFLETEDDPTVRKMAMREIRMLKKLRHENLVNMLEVFRRKKRFFLVFEYLEHTVLEELEARASGLGFITSRKYCYQVLRALDFIHSHDVIHRDIKPENVLVSRLGVIKLCDFGFARPYAENETFTDYVATRWYRSPELLVGDPRYGKEVDIWAVGCLYSEMMTGEPLFPGESDIDQLFQIIRVVGKLNSRHQILITRNAMFKGMKQEQNSSLHQLFPDWNRDCLDFLTQCLKMDGNQRPDTTKLLKHDLFTGDNFLDNFLVELRSKITQEMQGNPLLKRMPSYGSGRRNGAAEEKKSGGDRSRKNMADDPKYTQSKERISHLLSSQLININGRTNPELHRQSTNATNTEEINLNLSTLKHYLNSNSNNHPHQKLQKPISINNLVFKDGGKYSRVLSAKQQKITNHLNNNNVAASNLSDKTTNNFDLQIQPPSPVQFQSLQTESLISEPQHQKRLSPVSVNNLAISGNAPQYFSQKRSSNILGLQQVAAQKNNAKQSSQSNQLASRKRDRPLLDIGLMPLNGAIPDTKEISPRILPPPSWLTGNLKVTAQGKTTQIGKRGITDWKSVGTTTTSSNTTASTTQIPSSTGTTLTTNHKSVPGESGTNEFLLPDCPGATASPYKVNTGGNKKKLSPMISSDHHAHHLMHGPTPRNFSASSDTKNET